MLPNPLEGKPPNPLGFSFQSPNSCSLPEFLCYNQNQAIALHQVTTANHQQTFFATCRVSKHLYDCTTNTLENRKPLWRSALRPEITFFGHQRVVPLHCLLRVCRLARTSLFAWRRNAAKHLDTRTQFTTRDETCGSPGPSDCLSSLRSKCVIRLAVAPPQKQAIGPQACIRLEVLKGVSNPRFPAEVSPTAFGISVNQILCESCTALFLGRKQHVWKMLPLLRKMPSVGFIDRT